MNIGDLLRCKKDLFMVEDDDEGDVEQCFTAGKDYTILRADQFGVEVMDDEPSLHSIGEVWIEHFEVKQCPSNIHIDIPQ